MDDGTVGDDVAQRCVAATVQHLMDGGIGRFDSRYIANRAGLDHAVLQRAWPDQDSLLTAAWTSWLGWAVTSSQHDTLAGDLRTLSEAISEPVRSAQGRMIVRSSMPLDDRAEFSRARSAFWDKQFQAAAAVMQRALQRGEIRDRIDPVEAARSFCTALYFDALYLDQATPAEYRESVIDMFLHGVAQKPSGNPFDCRKDVAERIGATELDLLGEEKPKVDYVKVSTAEIRQAILDAAIKESTLSGADFVTRDAIARRAGVTTYVVERLWPRESDLLREAGDRAREKTRPMPDTGGLWGDLLLFAEAKSVLVSTTEARRNFLRIMPQDFSARNADVVVEFWAAGLRESTKMCVRAAERGEMRRGVNPDHATRALVAALYYDLFFRDAAMRPDYAALVVEVFLRGAGTGSPVSGAAEH